MTARFEQHAREMNTDPAPIQWTITVELLQLRQGKQVLLAHLDKAGFVTTRQWDVTPGQPITNVIQDCLLRLNEWIFDGVRLL